MTTKLGFKIIVSDSWIKGQTDPVPVVVEELAGPPTWVLVPTDEEERLAIAKRAGYCERCEGERRIPAGQDRKGQPIFAKCPRCDGKGLPLLSPPVMRAVFAHIVRGWSGWISAEGEEIPYSEATRDRVAVHRAIWAVIVARAQELKIRYEEQLEDFFEPGGEPSSEETSLQMSSSQASPSSSAPGASSAFSNATTSAASPAQTSPPGEPFSISSGSGSEE